MAIDPPRGRRRRAQVHLDDGLSLWLAPALVAEAGLAIGQAISTPQAEALLAADEVRHGLDIAHRLLAYRPRSQAEVEARLRRAGLAPETIAQVVHYLQEQGFLDDAAFARFWREERERWHPRGSRRLLWELEHLGISPELAQETVANLDEVANAYRAGQRLARHVPCGDPAIFHRRLEAGLRRRGFGGEAIRSVVERLWAEAQQGEAINLG